MAGIKEEVLNKGFCQEACSRLEFRLSWLIKAFQDRQVILKNGNLASWEPELAALNQNFEDLTDVMLELVQLLHISMNQKEQGLISPPNEDAPSSDTPTG